MKKLLCLLVVIPMLLACQDDHDDVDYRNHYIAMGTVLNPDTITNFSLLLDDTTMIKVDQSAVAYYRPFPGQRIIADFAVLSEYSDTTFDYSVKLYDVYEVLTKGIFNITEITRDSIGNDPVTIKDMWLGGGYLNVEFYYMGYNKTHYLNLVSDSSKTYTDGKIHLEFRHNDNDDYPQYNKWGIVSFKLNSLESDTTNIIDLAVEANEYYYGSRTYYFTYNYGNGQLAPVSRKIVPENTKAVFR